jgi:hypothetical protein
MFEQDTWGFDNSFIFRPGVPGRQNMVTRSKSIQNKPLPTHVKLPEHMEPSVDMFIIHDERIEGATFVVELPIVA